MDFDDIIVGGGSAGCALANRLSADPSRRVLLIEAGQDTPPGAIPPEISDSYPMPLFYGDRYLWPKLMVTASHTEDGAPVRRFYEQGRIIGGGSAVNVQAANRGLPRDYDEWASLGATGWGWDAVLPYFRKLENDLDHSGPLHGNDGPIPIRRIPVASWPPFGHAIAQAFAASGLPKHDDQNGEFDDGVFPAAISNQDDQRVSAARGYLTPTVRTRENLTIWTNTKLVRLVVANGRAETVVIRRADGTEATLPVRRLILTAGGLQTPAILMRAGIGPAADLQALGIQVAIDRPGVGRNLRDHPAINIGQYLPARLRMPPHLRRSNFVVLRYSSGVAGGSASDMYVAGSGRAGWHDLGRRLAMYVVWCNRPHSVGQLRLASSDPDAYADIDFNLLSDERDLHRLAEGVRKLAKLVVCKALNENPDDLFPATFTPRVRRLSLVSSRNRRVTAALGRLLDAPAPMRRLILRTFMLGGSSLAEIMSDDGSLHAFIRRHVFGIWHPSGTCRMGASTDPMAVVDPTGKLIGADNIWVADASVMPCLPTANTNIPTLMIAEKIAAGLLQPA